MATSLAETDKLFMAILRTVFIVLVLFVGTGLLSEAFNRRHLHQACVAVDQRYRDLVAAGRLDLPPEGMAAVTFVPLGGGEAFMLMLRDSDSAQREYRYRAVHPKARERRAEWLFLDKRAGKVIE